MQGVGALVYGMGAEEPICTPWRHHCLDYKVHHHKIILQETVLNKSVFKANNKTSYCSQRSSEGVHHDILADLLPFLLNYKILIATQRFALWASSGVKTN